MHDDLGAVNGKVTNKVMVDACPQHGCGPRGRASGERDSGRQQGALRRPLD